MDHFVGEPADEVVILGIRYLGIVVENVATRETCSAEGVGFLVRTDKASVGVVR